jgi:hypothetical protein
LAGRFRQLLAVVKANILGPNSHDFSSIYRDFQLKQSLDHAAARQECVDILSGYFSIDKLFYGLRGWL